jgi:prepilin-type N-terminal cleavage/methylation domain-containing protein
MNKGFTLIEMLIVILIGVLIIGVIVGLYIAHQRVQGPIKMTSDITEIQRAGITQLEWIFSRWGTGTPCYNYNGTNSTNPVVCTRVVSCDARCDTENPTYPPPSSLCVTKVSGEPCDEICFYANLEGVGVVGNVYRDIAQLVSCRLKTRENNNCFHIIRYGKFFTDDNNKTKVLIFKLKNLSPENVECLDEKYLNPYEYNAQVSRNATIYNGTIGNQTWLWLEGGDIIIRAPKRVHLYCENGPDGRLWLKMKLTDIAKILKQNLENNCNGIETINIAPVENFKAWVEYPSNSSHLASIRIRITFRNFENPGTPNYRTYTVERYFGR